jgi:hypothetical protein
MAKKKTTSSDDYLSGYIPASFNPSINPSQILQIPPYDDPGISFKGYSKRNKSSTEYQLFPQIRRTQTGQFLPGVTLITGARLDPGKIFYATSVHIDYHNSSGVPIQVTIIDGSNATDKKRIGFFINNDSDHFDIDFISSPRDFQTDNLSMNLSSALAAGDYLYITLAGWAE